MVYQCISFGRFLTCALTLSVLFAGCEAAQVAEGEVNENRFVRPVQLDPAERMRRMAGFDLGLELREWLIHSDVDEVGSVLARWAQEPATDSDLDERLRRNGLRIFRVPMHELEELESRLRPIGNRQRGWRGQVVRWDPLIVHRLRPEHRAVVIDGRVLRFDRQEFALMARSWIVQMEDGPRMLLNIVPTYQETDAGGYRRMLGRDVPHGRSISSLRVEMLVKPNEAIVVTSEAPGVAWDSSHHGAGDDDGIAQRDIQRDEREEDSTELESLVDRNGDRRDRRSDRHLEDNAFGPEADMPMTLGELLFDHPFDTRMGIRGRGLMIFVPHMTEDLMPPANGEQITDGDRTGR